MALFWLRREGGWFYFGARKKRVCALQSPGCHRHCCPRPVLAPFFFFSHQVFTPGAQFRTPPLALPSLPFPPQNPKKKGEKKRKGPRGAEAGSRLQRHDSVLCPLPAVQQLQQQAGQQVTAAAQQQAAEERERGGSACLRQRGGGEAMCGGWTSALPLLLLLLLFLLLLPAAAAEGAGDALPPPWPNK